MQMTSARTLNQKPGTMKFETSIQKYRTATAVTTRKTRMPDIAKTK
jgi:hypothetical protein